MRFVKAVALLTVAETALKHFVFPEPTPVSVALTIVSLAQLAAILVFCIAMRWFCVEAGMGHVTKSWGTTILLFGLLFVLPLGLFYVSALFAVLTGNHFNINLGPAGLLLVVVFVLPLVHLFISTSRMRRAAEAPSFSAPSPGGFPVVMPPRSTDAHSSEEPGSD